MTQSTLLDLALDAVEDRVPAGLADRVLAAASGGPGPGLHAGWASAQGDVLGAFLQTASEVAALLDAVAPDEWSRPTRVPGSTVRELAVHLVGVERYLLGQLGARPAVDAPAREQHAPVTRQAAADVAGEPGPAVAREWWLHVLAVARECGRAAPDQPLPYHHLPGTVGGVMVVRTFELWTHGDDIRHGLSRGLDPLDGARLALMSSQLMAVLPYGMVLTGGARPGATARFELTGEGGGSYLVPLAPGEAPGEPDVTIAAPVLDLCRLAANRLAVADLDALVTGDAELVEPILVGATAFAMD